MRLPVSLFFLYLSFVGACTVPDRSILTKEGDELLDCKALKLELIFARNLGENAAARRRHVKILQKKNQCLKKPKVSISIGLSKSFD